MGPVRLWHVMTFIIWQFCVCCVAPKPIRHGRISRINEVSPVVRVNSICLFPNCENTLGENIYAWRSFFKNLCSWLGRATAPRASFELISQQVPFNLHMYVFRLTREKNFSQLIIYHLEITLALSLRVWRCCSVVLVLICGAKKNSLNKQRVVVNLNDYTWCHILWHSRCSSHSRHFGNWKWRCHRPTNNCR